jgi:hypothetical protein
MSRGKWPVANSLQIKQALLAAAQACFARFNQREEDNSLCHWFESRKSLLIVLRRAIFFDGVQAAQGWSGGCPGSRRKGEITYSYFRFHQLS